MIIATCRELLGNHKHGPYVLLHHPLPKLESAYFRAAAKRYTAAMQVTKFKRNPHAMTVYWNRNYNYRHLLVVLVVRDNWKLGPWFVPCVYGD